MLGNLPILLVLFTVALPVRAAPKGFSESLYPVLQNAGCRACHNPDGVASASRLIFPPSGAPAGRIEAFGKSLVVLVDRNRPEESLLLQKPTQRIAHTGGQRIKPGSSEEAALRAWVRSLAALTGPELAAALKFKDDAPAGGAAPAVVLRRLSHSQYNNTVRDLLGDLTAPANGFPAEDFVNGFKNQYESQSLSPILAEAYAAAAEKLARNAFRRGVVDGLIRCNPSPACRAQFIRDFGLRAFRRPLEPAEQSRYETLFARETDFLKGAQLVVEAMLQSTSFLFRLEQTPDPRWKSYAAASRLAYTLWDSMPDEALMRAAADGELDTPAGVDRYARRMLDHPRARQTLDEFTSQWLRFDRLLTTTRDRRRYPQFSRETAVAMTQEARQFIGHLVWNGRNFMEAFTADYGFPNAELAAIYSVPAPVKEFEPVTFPAPSERAGLLGQALVLALTSKPDDTSPTARGLFVREQFLCQHVPPPPPGVDTNLPAVTEARPQANRGRLTEHVTNPSCAGCHNLVDPIGFALEKFDAIGARRDTLKLRFFGEDSGGERRTPAKIVEVPIDTSGWIAGIADSKLSSPREMGALLARSPQCQECMVKQYFRFTAGRTETPADYPLIRSVTEQFRNSGFQFREMMVALVRAREFPPDKGGKQDVARNHKAK